MKHIKDILLAVLAGIAISIGGTIFLTLDNKMVGATMFAVGLYTICDHKLNLVTGKAGYMLGKDASYYLFLLEVWFGNLVGAFLTAELLSFTRTGVKLQEIAYAAVASRLSDSLVSLFILGIFCGILVYSAVEGYRNGHNPILLLMCVAVFILCSFEHCVADMFYFSMAKVWSLDVMIRTIAITLGNVVGCVAIPLVQRLKTE